MKFVQFEKSAAVEVMITINPALVRSVGEVDAAGICVLFFAPGDSVKVKGTLQQVVTTLEKGLNSG